MKILKNHFDNKDTYIVGKLIKNGCQTFEIQDLDFVCFRFGVSDRIKNSCKEAYEENSKTPEDYKALATNPDIYVRALLVLQKQALDILVNDNNWRIRFDVADINYGLDKLVDDPDWRVREQVANKGYGLEKLINDPVYYVRIAVAKQGYGLDKLASDVSLGVRRKVSKKGFRLNKPLSDADYSSYLETINPTFLF